MSVYEDFRSGLDAAETRYTVLRRYALLAVAGLAVAVGGAAVTTHTAQRQVRAAERQGVAGCDAGWSLCRFKATGQSPADEHLCSWVNNPEPSNDPIFSDPKAGYYSVCSHSPAPTDEPADDDSACGQAWRVCFDLATATPGAGR